jgi:hypothetical protein
VKAALLSITVEPVPVRTNAPGLQASGATIMPWLVQRSALSCLEYPVEENANYSGDDGDESQPFDVHASFLRVTLELKA